MPRTIPPLKKKPAVAANPAAAALEEKIRQAEADARGKPLEPIVAALQPAVSGAEPVPVKAKKPKFVRVKAGQRDFLVHQRGRLPDGSEYRTVYDAAVSMWKGTLVVPGLPTFTDSASGVFRLLEKLDGQFRAWPGKGETLSAESA